jgi:hypothetical protein
MPVLLWPAQTIFTSPFGVGLTRQSVIWKNRPFRSDRPVAHSSRRICTYSAHYS